jgi:hypothetical protein
MDWDSTLAHWPYHALRAEAMTFLDGSGIDLKTVGTTFPNKNTGENLMLNGDLRLFAEKDFDKNQWMMTSNVLNDFSEAEHEQLERDWQLKWAKSKRGVWIKIYARSPVQ